MNKESADKSREHLANERTFLAWVRTGLAFIGLGFVIVKFGLFMKQLAVLMEGKLVLPVRGYSTSIGVIMVAVGIVLAVFSFIQYRRTGKHIDRSDYQPSSFLPLLLTLTILIGGVVLVIYLMPGLRIL